jgi:hypothetical protein
MARDRKIIEHYGVQEYSTKADFPPASDPGPTTIYARDVNSHYKTNGTEWIGEGYSDSIANRPSAALFGKGTWLVAGKFMFVSDGTSFTASGPFLLHENTLGYLVPSLAAANASTYSQSGNIITVTNGGVSPVAHNIPDVINNGSSVYLAMGVAATGATIPAGWFTNFTYIDANTFSCVSATSQVGTGTVNTNLAITTLTPNAMTINGGLLGKQGSFEITVAYRNNNSGGSKTLRCSHGGTTILVVAPTNVTVGRSTEVVWNLNSESVQGATSTTINTAVDSSLTQSIAIAAANDYMSLIGTRVTVYSNII